MEPLEGRRALAAEFDVHVFFSDPLALERRAESHGDRGLRDRDLEAAHLDALFHDLVGVQFLGDLFIDGHAGGMNFGNVRVRDGREAHIDRAGARRPDTVVQGPQHHGKGEHLVFGVFQDLFEIELRFPEDFRKSCENDTKAELFRNIGCGCDFHSVDGFFLLRPRGAVGFVHVHVHRDFVRAFRR